MLSKLSLSGTVLAVFGGVFLTVITLLGISRCQVDNLNKEVAALKEKRDTLADTARVNNENFQECEERRQDLLDDMRIQEKATEKANLTVQRLRKENENLSEAERGAREEFYNEPTCSRVTDLYLCDSVINSLRRQASSRTHGSEGSRGSSDP